MIKGGYKIVNFNGAALSGVSETLPGIYAQIVDDYDKPIMVSGVSLNGDIMDDAYASVQEKIAGDLSKSVELTVYGGIITVTEDDEVTFVLSKTTAELTAEIGDLEDLETTDKTSMVAAINEVKSTSDNTIIQPSEFTLPEGWTVDTTTTTGKFNDISYDITLSIESETGLANETRLTLNNVLPENLSVTFASISAAGLTNPVGNIDKVVGGFVSNRIIAIDNFSGSTLRKIMIHIAGLR